MQTFATFDAARSLFSNKFISRSYEVKAPHWQGVDVSRKPDMAMRELFSESFQVPLRGIEELEHWQKDIKPNLPFADITFAERVGGEPLNPGESWKVWPWGNSADKFRDVNGQFDHTYQERFWPKFAGLHYSPTGTLLDRSRNDPNSGIRFEYGDLDDLIEHLLTDPLSRQAYLPIWFPEDGSPKAKRKPCTLGYHFLMRHRYLHLTYHIRSCDFIRHWADDCYLAVRLLMHILAELRGRDKYGHWSPVKPGMYVMHIASFHMFVNDWILVKAAHDNPPQRFQASSR
jgi:hypothetical protein